MCVEEDSRGPLQLSRIGGRLPPWFPHKRSSPHKSFHPPPPTLSPAYNASDDENKGDHLLGVLMEARITSWIGQLGRMPHQPGDQES